MHRIIVILTDRIAVLTLSIGTFKELYKVNIPQSSMGTIKQKRIFLKT